MGCVAASQVRIPASCQILYIKKKNLFGEWTLLDPRNKKSNTFFKFKIIKL